MHDAKAYEGLGQYSGIATQGFPRHGAKRGGRGRPSHPDSRRASGVARAG